MSERSRGLRMALPKGRMQAGVSQLLADAGLRVLGSERDYRPSLNCPDMELKMLKPQNIVEMLGCGSMDAGFAGADWIAELAGELDAV
ncbi:MAG TPA: ATP phosphoribosyltransferase, partial [Spirochaetales bacterium]|nr:ATP phosphoribosyltransferase [Spirochaetales bacterium]